MYTANSTYIPCSQVAVVCLRRTANETTRRGIYAHSLLAAGGCHGPHLRWRGGRSLRISAGGTPFGKGGSACGIGTHENHAAMTLILREVLPMTENEQRDGQIPQP